MMNRSRYYNYIAEKLNLLASMIESNGKLNLLDMHIHSEFFFRDFFNILFGWNLENLNTTQQNIEGIDLIDHNNKIIVQVSATCTKQKINNSLEKDIFNKYVGYEFMFISISKDAVRLRTQSFNNPHNVQFNPLQDIFDVNSLLGTILGLTIDKQKELYDWISKELGNQVDYEKIDSNLAEIVSILAQGLVAANDEIEIQDFEIMKKIEFNQLSAIDPIIRDCFLFNKQITLIYQEYDKQGANKSHSVLQAIKKKYVLLSIGETADSVSVFFQIIEDLKQFVSQSANFSLIPAEELDLYVSILVVDAFTRCKIFKNPTRCENAIA